MKGVVWIEYLFAHQNLLTVCAVALIVGIALIAFAIGTRK